MKSHQEVKINQLLNYKLTDVVTCDTYAGKRLEVEFYPAYSKAVYKVTNNQGVHQEFVDNLGYALNYYNSL